MRKNKLISNWGDILYVLTLPVQLYIFFQAFALWFIDGVVAFGLTIFYVCFTVIALVRLIILKKTRRTFQDWSYLFSGLLLMVCMICYFIAARLLLVNFIVSDWFRDVGIWLFVCSIIFSIARFSIWLHNRHQAKKAEANHDTNE